MFLSCGNEVLQKAKNALDSENVLFWLDYGTLLGAYREHDFIKHDFDLDIGLWLKDAEIAKKAMLKNGFELIRCFQIKTMSAELSIVLHTKEYLLIYFL